jgi:hypothetical protein
LLATLRAFHAPPFAPLGERRTVQTLFADVRGLTPLATQGAPREAIAAVTEVFDLIAQATASDASVVHGVLGIGMLSVFGGAGAVDDHAVAELDGAHDHVVESLAAAAVRRRRPTPVSHEAAPAADRCAAFERRSLRARAVGRSGRLEMRNPAFSTTPGTDDSSGRRLAGRLVSSRRRKRIAWVPRVDGEVDRRRTGRRDSRTRPTSRVTVSPASRFS